MTHPASSILAEDFAHVADLIERYVERGPAGEADLRAVLSNNFNVILAALRIAAKTSPG
jgi:hypothetical protein